MTREEKQKAIDALKISAPIMAVTQEEFKDYIQTLNKIMDWLEQEPKSEWEQDHAMLKAYSDGANDVLDKIRAEIVDLGRRTMNDNRASGIWACRDIIDKYKAESEDKE
jgi:hypothetical protein